MKKKTVIKMVCMICKKEYGQKDGKGQSGVSHGYCKKCYKEAMKKIDEKYPMTY